MGFIQDFFTSSNTKTKYYISEDVLEELLIASENALPTEFLALLSVEHSSKLDIANKTIENAQIITTYYIIPDTKLEDDSATLKTNNIPISETIIGSFHSHPNGYLKPSDADSNMFQKYPINIIAGPPFTTNSWKCFNNKGKHIDLKTVSVSDDPLSERWTQEIQEYSNIE